MNLQTKVDAAASAPLLTKLDPNSPAILIVDIDTVLIKAGTVFNGVGFDSDTAADFAEKPSPGQDYSVHVKTDGTAHVVKAEGLPTGDDVLGGFHYAPGGNALTRSGGDTVPAINPYSLWDRNFRPACSDPRGMALVEMTFGRNFWCDIYLCARDHDGGTSRFGVTIADGDDVPSKFKRFDYEAALAVMSQHGKQLLSFEEFAAAAYGVTEKTAIGDDPETTRLDAPRTSKFGIMQATGNLWIWGHDGDPDEPRASIFGGDWWSDGSAGSRCAHVAYYWPGGSDVDLGARGRSDHLQPV